MFRRKVSKKCFSLSNKFKNFETFQFCLKTFQSVLMKCVPKKFPKNVHQTFQIVWEQIKVFRRNGYQNVLNKCFALFKMLVNILECSYNLKYVSFVWKHFRVFWRNMHPKSSKKIVLEQIKIFNKKFVPNIFNKKIVLRTKQNVPTIG